LATQRQIVAPNGGFIQHIPRQHTPLDKLSLSSPKNSLTFLLEALAHTSKVNWNSSLMDSNSAAGVSQSAFFDMNSTFVVGMLLILHHDEYHGPFGQPVPFHQPCSM
jgi:hypothetical protein